MIEAKKGPSLDHLKPDQRNFLFVAFQLGAMEHLRSAAQLSPLLKRRYRVLNEYYFSDKTAVEVGRTFNGPESSPLGRERIFQLVREAVHWLHSYLPPQEQDLFPIPAIGKPLSQRKRIQRSETYGGYLSKALELATKNTPSKEIQRELGVSSARLAILRKSSRELGVDLGYTILPEAQVEKIANILSSQDISEKKYKKALSKIKGFRMVDRLVRLGALVTFTDFCNAVALNPKIRDIAEISEIMEQNGVYVITLKRTIHSGNKEGKTQTYRYVASREFDHGLEIAQTHPLMEKFRTP